MNNITSLERAVEYQVLKKSIANSIYPHKPNSLRGDHFYYSLSVSDKLAILEAYVDDIDDLNSLFEEIEEHTGYTDIQAEKNRKEIEADEAYLNRHINL